MTQTIVTSPMIERLLIKEGYKLLDATNFDAFTLEDGVKLLFLTGDYTTNLETNDAAIILPELVRTFKGQFTPAIIAPDFEKTLRHKFEVWATPSFIFIHKNHMIGAIAKVRDWSDYISEINSILDDANLGSI